MLLRALSLALMMSLAAVVSGLTLSPGVAYAATQTDDTQQETSKQETKKSKKKKKAKKKKAKDKRVCKKVRTTGSRIAEKVCMRESKWKQVEEDSQRDVRDMRDRVGSAAERE